MRTTLDTMKLERPAPAETATILVVDDVDPWRRAACMTLMQGDSCSVVGEAADGREAVQKAQELQPDVILLDIGLPLLNGIEAASQIRNVAPNAKVVFLTQNNDPDVVREALSHGVAGYVLKMDAGIDLLPALEAVLRGETFLSNGLKSCSC
ncbi:MAG TPA: response regulator transcription factor [Terriglobales bacterium]|nr:response regulator transcription factor [Terriglobales bacterium]